MRRTHNRTILYFCVTMLVLFMLFLYKPLPAGEMTNEDCLGCHSDKTLEAETLRGKTLKLFVPENVLTGSAHEGFSCTDCHKGSTEDAFEDVPHGSTPPKVVCGECHEEAMEEYSKQDIHGKAFQDKNPRAPYCSNCHGGHNILPMSSPDSRMSHKNQDTTCGQCHGQEKLNLQDNITKRNLIHRFRSSVHKKAIDEGKTGATCTDCHGHHTIMTSASPQSTVSRNNIMDVCRKCHEKTVDAYLAGPHGRSLRHGNNDVPNCITCHGDHDMASLRDRQGDAKQWASTRVCIWCHNNDRMMARYGLDTIPVKSYMKDFHGLTQRGTMGASATCSDCHDPHHSLPSTHPASRMHLTNRGAACGKCHGKVTENFAQSFTHRKAMEKPGGNLEEIIRTIYIILIIASVGGMLLYNAIVWLWAVRKKFKTQRKQRHVMRMARFERIAHVLLLSSFITLAVTGFALKFPEAFWAKWLFSMGMTEAVRTFIHRFAAAVMVFDLAGFMAYLAFKKRGHCMFKKLLPAKRDITDFFQSVKFYLHPKESHPHPRFGVFNFAEKFEFWALMWGTVVMVITGLILAFPKAVPADWPSWVISVARVIHYYEALLATLAILIWHMFQVMFHPAEYPMNTSWITGYITEGEARHRFEDTAIQDMQTPVEEKFPKADQSKKSETIDSETESEDTESGDNEPENKESEPEQEQEKEQE